MSTEAERRPGEPQAARTRLGRAKGVLRFLAASWKANLASALEYRLSFVLLAGMMFVNNMIWLLFWGLFFHNFPVVQGWSLEDVMMLWAVSAGGYGWASVLFGNYTRVASIVASGQLDVYLSQPKPVLLNVVASRSSVTAVGDFLFGLVIFALVGNHSLYGFAAFALSLLLAGLLFLGVITIAGCLAFFIGNSEGIATQALNSFISLTTYPVSIFKGLARLALFSIVPAGFISYMPVGLLRGFEPGFAAAAVGMTVFVCLAATVLFRFGLRRYASGNAIAMRD